MTRAYNLRFEIALAAAAIAVGLWPAVGGAAALSQAAVQASLPVPLRLSAFAVNMSNTGTGRTNVVDIRVTRWTTEQERTKLLTTMVEKGDKALLGALQDMPDAGRMRIPGWQGPDPHKVVLGWTLRYAWSVPDGDGGHRLLLATDRYVTFLEARNQPRTMDYPFTLFVEIRLGKDGKGVGKASMATKISFDKKKNLLELENYGSEPIRLNEVKIEQ
jgi:hypothetical protein